MAPGHVARSSTDHEKDLFGRLPNNKSVAKHAVSKKAAEVPMVPGPALTITSNSGCVADFRDVMTHLFATNKLSAVQSHAVAHSATHAGAQGVEDLSKCGSQGNQPGNLRSVD